MAPPAQGALATEPVEAEGLYPALLGAAWDLLPAAVRKGHDTSRPFGYRGALSVRGGRTAAARLVAALLRLPRPGEGVPVRLVVTPEGEGCRWCRTFGGRGGRGERTLTTRQLRQGDRLVERFGLLDLFFLPFVEEGRLSYRQTGAALRLGRLRLPLPRPWMPVVRADAWVPAGDSAMRDADRDRGRGPPGGAPPRLWRRRHRRPGDSGGMNGTMNAVLWLLAAQGLLGTFDTLYYHEWKAKLPARNPGTGLELKLHAARDFVYSLIFLTLPWIAWHGPWAALLSALILFEIVVTIVDFTTEDFVRKPLGGVFPGERATHTVMAIVYGAMLGNLVPVLLAWWEAPAGLVYAPVPVAPALRWLLTLLGIGVLVSGVRDLGSALGFPHWEWPWSMPEDERRSE